MMLTTTTTTDSEQTYKSLEEVSEDPNHIYVELDRIEGYNSYRIMVERKYLGMTLTCIHLHLVIYALNVYYCVVCFITCTGRN